MADNLKQTLQECNTVCKELSSLLEQENVNLQEKRDVKAVENNIKNKRQLTLQLEKFVGVIKVNFETIRASADMVTDLNMFKNLIEVYKTLVAKNAMLLQAAHSATSMILGSIQKQTARPAVKTYNAYGYSQETPDRGPSLINYSV
tara:strand:- start:149 stop:586 length:438 start_codon:yes stop_codon:yes gene_type:complete